MGINSRPCLVAGDVCHVIAIKKCVFFNVLFHHLYTFCHALCDKATILRQSLLMSQPAERERELVGRLPYIIQGTAGFR